MNRRKVPPLVWMILGVIAVLGAYAWFVRTSRNASPNPTITVSQQPQAFATVSGGGDQPTQTVPTQIETPPIQVSLTELGDFDRSWLWYQIPQPGKGSLQCGNVVFTDPGAGYGFVTVSVNGSEIGTVTYTNYNRRLDTGVYHMNGVDVPGGPNNIAGVMIGDSTYIIFREILTAKGHGWWVIRPSTDPCVVVQ